MSLEQHYGLHHDVFFNLLRQKWIDRHWGLWGDRNDLNNKTINQIKGSCMSTDSWIHIWVVNIMWETIISPVLPNLFLVDSTVQLLDPPGIQPNTLNVFLHLFCFCPQIYTPLCPLDCHLNFIWINYKLTTYAGALLVSSVVHIFWSGLACFDTSISSSCVWFFLSIKSLAWHSTFHQHLVWLKAYMHLTSFPDHKENPFLDSKKKLEEANWVTKGPERALKQCLPISIDTSDDGNNTHKTQSLVDAATCLFIWSISLCQGLCTLDWSS